MSFHSQKDLIFYFYYYLIIKNVGSILLSFSLIGILIFELLLIIKLIGEDTIIN